MLDPQEKLRLLARDDAAFIQAEIVGDPHPLDGEALDRKTRAIVRLAALIALDAPETSYSRLVREALAAGVAASELVRILIALAPSVGMTRVVAAAPRLAKAIGYDIDEAFET